MGQLVTFSAAVRDESILEAVQRQTPAVLTVCAEGRWVTLKTRIARADAQGRVLALASLVPHEGQPAVTCCPGQCVSLTFRRGHRKCMFVTTVTSLDDKCPDAAIWLRWPDEVLAVQRRAFYRAVVPDGLEVPVRLWRGGRAKRRLVAVNKWPSVSGPLMDVSAGGMRMELPADADPGIVPGEPVAVEFSPLKEVGQVCLDGNFRYCLPLADGRVALGVQFVGLESSPAGRQMLLVLGQVSAEYLRRANRTPPRDPAEPEPWRPPVDLQNSGYEPARPAR